MAKSEIIVVEESSGNVFADLALPNPARELLKAHSTLEIPRIVKSRALKQAGKILAIRPPHVSSLKRARSVNFSLERLMEFLTKLDHDVEITVRPQRKDQAGMSLVVE